MEIKQDIQVRIVLAIVATIILFVGIGFYNECRSGVVLSPILNYFPSFSFVECTSSIGHYLPSFVHQLTLPILCGIFNKSLGFMRWNVFWLAVNGGCEFGQLIETKTSLGLLPNNLANYFTFGTFDLYDIGSILVAFSLIYLADAYFRQNELHDT